MAPSEGLASVSAKAYVKLQTPHKFFKVGRVFESDGGSVYVVVQEGYSSSTCCELQLPGQNANVNYYLPNTATLSLQGYLTRSYPTPSDNQYQLILECLPDGISPLYFFDFSKCLVLSHQTQVYKIGRVDRKSIKRLEAMFTAANTPSAPSDTVTAITPESTKMETPSLETPSFYSKNLYNNPTKTNHSLARSPSNKSRSKRSPETDWNPWEYNADRRCYVTSRTNERGEEELQYSGECSPPRVETPVEDLHSASGATYEPELKGEETFRDGSVLAPRSNAEPSPQYASMAAVDNTVDLAPQYATMAAAGNITYPRSSFPGSESSTRSSQALAPVTPSYLEKSYIAHRSSDFKPGSVFKVLWTEPRGLVPSDELETEDLDGYLRPVKYGEQAYTSIRRFIVIRAHEGHSLCLPILTYARRGTTKPGVKPEHHAIIYSTRLPPSKLSGEQELLNEPIRIEVTSPRHILDPASRINYAKVYTLEHNIKVAFIGRVHKDSRRTFIDDYRRIQSGWDDPSGRDYDAALNNDNVAKTDDDVAMSEVYATLIRKVEKEVGH